MCTLSLLSSDPYAHSKKAVDLVSRDINTRMNHKVFLNVYLSHDNHVISVSGDLLQHHMSRSGGHAARVRDSAPVGVVLSSGPPPLTG